jgi:hypothetical protein
MFTILDKKKSGIESIRGLNLEGVKHTTVHMTRLVVVEAIRNKAKSAVLSLD